MTGLLSGFSQRKAEIEAQNIREAELAREREGRVYEALINSPDPDVQSAAITGLLESARPGRRKGGFAGWVGEMEANPAFARIQELIRTPVTETQEIQGPAETQGYIPTPPPTAGAAALPPTSPTQIGAPPPTPVQSRVAQIEAGTPITPDVRAATTPRPTRKVTTSRPRQVFATPYDIASQQAAGQYGGRVEGVLQALKQQGVTVTPDLARQVALELSGFSGGAIGSAPFQSIAGEVVHPDGSTEPAFGIFNRATQQWTDIGGQPLANFRPRPTGAGYRFGVTREAIAKAKYGKDFSQLDQTQAADVLREEQEVARQMSSARALGAEQGQYIAPIDVRTAQLTGGRVGTTSAQYEGQRVGSAQQQQRRIAANDILSQLGHIKTLLGPLPKAGELAGVAPGAAMAIRRRAPGYRDQIAQLESAINNIRASLTRTMQANVGTETERDAERALSTLADFEGRLLDPLRGDTQESATARIDETLRYLEQVIASIPGVPVPTGPAVGAPPPGAAAAPGAAGPVGYTVDDQGRLLYNGQPVP